MNKVCEEEETEREKQRADALAVSDGKTRRLVRLGDSACEKRVAAAYLLR